MSKEPTYTITISVGLQIGLSTCKQSDELEIQVPVAEWDAMDEDAREEFVAREAGEWANNYIDYWGEVTKVTKGGAADA